MDLPKYITFDCYGTLVDFQINQVTRDLLGSRQEQIDDIDVFLREFSTIRFQEVLEPYKRYSDVLRVSTEKAFTKFGLAYSETDGDAIVAAVPTWGPFADVPPILKRLRQHCKLVIISNAEDEMIAHNVRNIGVPFDHVITAEQAKAYKPSLAAFEYALQVMGCDATELLHVAQGFTYDIVPASKLGWRRVWINRNRWEGDPVYGPYNELPDLTGLPSLLGI